MLARLGSVVASPIGPMGRRGKCQDGRLRRFTPLGRGPVDLDDPGPGGGNGGRDPDPVAGGAVDTDRLQRAVTNQPGDRTSVASRGGRELPVIDLPAQASVDRDMDRVLVRVDTADVARFLCHDGAALHLWWVGTGRTGQTGHTPGPRTRQARLGHARPAGAVTSAARAGLISPSATQQGASQIPGHDPRSPTSKHVR
jgi:hypothetical protein